MTFQHIKIRSLYDVILTTSPQFAVMTSGAGEFAEAAACAANMAGVNCISVVPKSTCRTSLEVGNYSSV